MRHYVVNNNDNDCHLHNIILIQEFMKSKTKILYVFYGQYIKLCLVERRDVDDKA